MGQVTIKYGSNEHVWAQGDHVNEVDESARLEIITAGETVLLLKTYDSQEEAEDARELLMQKISEGLGNGEVIVTIDDL